MKQMKLLSPTGHLGLTPLEKGSFYEGIKHQPDLIAADSGSCDIGPYPLGADTHASPEEWQRHDLEVMLLESRKLGIPMIVGSASDTGTNRGVNQYVALIKEIAREHHLPPFTLAYIYAEVSPDYLLERLKRGERIEGLQGRPDLTPEVVRRTDRIVAQMGVEPIIRALDQGADVIITGRTSDANIFAAPAIRAGFPKNLAYYMGKVLECASFCAEPFMGKESVMGTLTEQEVFVEPMHPQQRCTPASIASHAMYERIDPFFEHVAGGVLDMRQCNYEQYTDRITRVTGPRFTESSVYKVKLEGAGKVGERALAIVGIRDPATISYIDQLLTWSRTKVRERFGEGDFQVFYHVYGRNGVMGDLEPQRVITSQELCIVTEVVAPTFEAAEEICALASRNLFYARLPEVKGTAGTAALMADEILRGKAGYEWTIHHLLPLTDPLELFPITLEQVGG
ncbi:MAG: acyclic terpene utilization AtuA family protein [Nitrospinota bacterium]|nr:MAG: acyclic terpene utilization AtuA family protein [Nitrospinota bacterium]